MTDRLTLRTAIPMSAIAEAESWSAPAWVPTRALGRAVLLTGLLLLLGVALGRVDLVLLARARAAMAGRDFVVPEDVKDVAVPALAHRITLRPEMWLRRVDPAFVVQEVLTNVPAPASGALPTYARHD